VKINHESDERAAWYLRSVKLFDWLEKKFPIEPGELTPTEHWWRVAAMAWISAEIARTPEDVYVNACEGLAEARKEAEEAQAARFRDFFEEQSNFRQPDKPEPSSDVLNTGITSGAVE
jgi:hypothetical protein